ncbi:META and DUF4377 domain-containing protein [Alcaligenaceae bacterium]|nr:META and DUF4377 domain-containing protein [Alcaligenaceae bacterium]
MKRSIFWLCTVLAIQGLSACAQQRGGAAPDAASVTPDTLTAYHWQLDQTPVATPKPVQLTFTDQRVMVSGLCNKLIAGYSINGAAMQIQQVAGTMRMCNDPGLMKYEQEVGAHLEKVKSWAIVGAGIKAAAATPVLTLKFDDGSLWTLNGKPTNETKYGSVGETIFLEIQPQLVSCSHPLIANKQCMQVRTVDYDGSGIKRKLGEWQAFYDDIEGYKHIDGVRNILRVKRYTIANPPADASRYAYVLDMTVESEQK